MSEAPPLSLRILVASSDRVVIEACERAVDESLDRLRCATDVAEALEMASSEEFQVAFVDVTMDEDAGLALVHHLPALSRGIAVHALAPGQRMELASEAVSLGAVGLMVTPPTGDGILLAIGEVRTRIAERAARAALEAELASVKRHSELLDRVLRLARGSGHSEAVRAIVEALAESSGATGVALYTSFDLNKSECVRLAATGTAREFATICRSEDVAKLVEERNARLVPLQAPQGTIGLAIFDGASRPDAADPTAMINLATVVLSLLDNRQSRSREAIKGEGGRVYTYAYFCDTATREIEKAKRHSRRLSVCSIVLDPQSDDRARAELEDAVLSVVRDTDVFAMHADNEYFLLLPETGTIGAHACRRRLLLRAEGDRRARAAGVSADRRAPTSRKPLLSIGVASYPHEGVALDRLVRTARRRSSEQARSAVHSLALGPMALGEMVDALLARPILDAGVSSPFPLELSTPALLSLVSQACREARRGGGATVLVTMQPGMALVSSARQAVRDATDVTVRVVDARGLEGCADLEAIIIAAEHGTWICCGRVQKERFRGVHASDPLLADLVSHRIVHAAGARQS